MFYKIVMANHSSAHHHIFHGTKILTMSSLVFRCINTLGNVEFPTSWMIVSYHFACYLSNYPFIYIYSPLFTSPSGDSCIIYIYWFVLYFVGATRITSYFCMRNKKVKDKERIYRIITRMRKSIYSEY